MHKLANKEAIRWRDFSSLIGPIAPYSSPHYSTRNGEQSGLLHTLQANHTGKEALQVNHTARSQHITFWQGQYGELSFTFPTIAGGSNGERQRSGTSGYWP